MRTLFRKRKITIIAILLLTLIGLIWIGEISTFWLKSDIFTTASSAPTASLTANGVNNLNLKIGTPLSYVWSSTNAVSGSSTYIATPSRCGPGGVWSANTIRGSLPATVLPTSYVGCTYTITYTVKNSTGVQATSILTVSISASPVITSISPVIGTPEGNAMPITIKGSGFTITNNNIYFGNELVAQGVSANTSGTSLSFPLPSRIIGVYDVKVSNTNGISNTKTFTIIAPPTANITAINAGTGANNIPRSWKEESVPENVTIATGTKVIYTWSSTNADRASSTYTATPSRCGPGGVWSANTINGTLTSSALPTSYAGCVFTITYTVTQTSTGVKAISTIIINIASP